MFNNANQNSFKNRPQMPNVPKTGGGLAGMPQKPSGIAGINKTMNKQNPFANLKTDKTGPAKQVMNSKGQNLIHNSNRGIK